MSGYTILMVAALFAAITTPKVRLGSTPRLDFHTANAVRMMVLSSIPFFAVPGLSDLNYLPFEPNSPIIGGVLAFIVSALIFKWAAERWQYGLSLLLGTMMVWNGFYSLKYFNESVHAGGLEIIFYSMMLYSVVSQYADFGADLPPVERKNTGQSQWRSSQ